jgi:hypothetical protein
MAMTVKMGNYDAIDLMAPRPMAFAGALGDLVTPVSADDPLPVSVAQAGLNYKLAAASATTTMAQGGAGAAGDYLSHVNIQPTGLALAAFQILDNAVVVHDSAAQTLLELRHITVPIGAFSVSGAWKIVMGSGGKATGFGIF